jgi:hypothetical protein
VSCVAGSTADGAEEGAEDGVAVGLDGRFEGGSAAVGGCAADAGSRSSSVPSTIRWPSGEPPATTPATPWRSHPGAASLRAACTSIIIETTATSTKATRGGLWSAKTRGLRRAFITPSVSVDGDRHQTRGPE